jgi:hypothetical protein
LQKEQAEQSLKNKCDLYRQTRAFLSMQLEEKRLAELRELEAKKAEELQLAQKLNDELRLEKEKGLLS